MAQIVRWSALAKDDLRDAAGHIADDSVHYAEVFIDDILAASARLGNFPRIGHVVPEFDNPDLRELSVRGYRLIYEVADDDLVVHALVHGARDLVKLWKRRR